MGRSVYQSIRQLLGWSVTVSTPSQSVSQSVGQSVSQSAIDSFTQSEVAVDVQILAKHKMQSLKYGMMKLIFS